MAFWPVCFVMSLFGRGKPDCVVVPLWRAFAGAGCYGCAGMGGKPARPSPSVTAQCVLLAVIFVICFAHAVCVSRGAPGAAKEENPQEPAPQLNATALGQII